MMAINFIGPLLILTGIISLAGTIYGLVKKDRQITKLSLIVFIAVVFIFLVVEGFLME